MGSTKRKTSSQQPDFKRIKAKVGKRALKPANETDTTFRAASLRVSGQAVVGEAATDGSLPVSYTHLTLPTKA